MLCCVVCACAIVYIASRPSRVPVPMSSCIDGIRTRAPVPVSFDPSLPIHHSLDDVVPCSRSLTTACLGIQLLQRYLFVRSFLFSSLFCLWCGVYTGRGVDWYRCRKCVCICV